MSFDTKVHIRNGKGALISKQPYRLVIEQGVSRFERPPGSGDWYDAGGTPLKKAEVKPESKKG